MPNFNPAGNTEAERNANFSDHSEMQHPVIFLLHLKS